MSSAHDTEVHDGDHDAIERRRAGEAILALAPIDLPSPEDLRRELDAAHAAGLV